MRFRRLACCYRQSVISWHPNTLAGRPEGPSSQSECQNHGSSAYASTVEATRRLSVYDAVYLELAQQLGFALAALDANLLRITKAEGMELIRS